MGILFAGAMTSAQVQPGGAASSAAALEPPVSNAQLTVHTLVREDIFAGFLGGEMTSFARGEKNIDLLLKQRPDQKANLLAWKGGATLYRAVRAHQAHKTREYQTLSRQARDLFAQAATFKTGNDGVGPVTGGSYVLFADSLPEADRGAAWALAYDAYHSLVKQQESVLDKLPVHFRGEALGGLALSAARTGHTEESAQTLDKMLVVLRDTPYEAAVRQWKETPNSPKNPSITCLGCHDAGRLTARLGALEKK